MSRAGRLFWATGIAAALLFAVLAVMGIFWLEVSGLPIFDSQFTGYQVDDARAYLSGISADARAMYLGPFRILDTIFPALATVTMMGVIWLHSVAWQMGVRLAILALPLSFLMFDYLENAQVAALLRVGPDVHEAAILQASLFTQIKWPLFGLSLFCALVAWRAGRKQGMRI